ncbi:hypothetical protein Lepto7376_1306 [[Leptolyngbya] sp. PCC 7376]|uniref:DUF3747 domain-containing protein n=1 Tax=[Leptolyngbya] sp. PCC 7376 TaxID=111781 RepID=UPI00029EDB67|nr:DUF3747 domain-containing protein [[Leptolyngbya] sp. PCC 7376]AFY37658.1 hypothetical protein Lepto7376_1306 [[Leptolyngbya] sp. PCC 7376]
MKIRFPLSLLLASTAMYFGLWGHSQANATLFGANQIDESEAVAIAVPINDGESYNLVILEQLNQQRQCWREQGDSPTVIDPLLLSFDFTGICGRSTDSNGYSLRLGGEDMAWKYDLRLVFERNELKLKAFNSSNPWRSPIEVGSTRGLAKGTLKIHLNAGWTLGKRTYQGKTLGHIYMVNENSANQLVANVPSHASVSSPKTTPTTNIGTQTNRNFSNRDTDNTVQIFVPPPQQATAINIPAAPTVQSTNFSTVSTSTNGLAPVPVPNRSIPTNDSDSSGYVRLNSGNLQPPPPPISLAQSLGLKYKVIVNATTNWQKTNLKKIVPDAFNTWVGDRRLMQAGAFADEIEAQELQERLREAGFSSEIVTIR